MAKITFLPAVAEPNSFSEEYWKSVGLTDEQARMAVEHARNQKVYLSACGTYQVNVVEGVEHEGFPPLTWLSIKRVDREPLGDWRIKQQIKNAMIGDEREAVELYPAESRLVDGANQYHLYALPEGMCWPFGFVERLVDDKPLGKSKNRPLPKDEDKPRDPRHENSAFGAHLRGEK